jgi:putative hydrolase of the HAD superfamily
MIRSVMFDFGGVLTSSPFEWFARYERLHGLPPGCIRALNATNPDTNAWARLERSEISFDEFCHEFEAEAAAAGFSVDARAAMSGLSGTLRPEMVEVVRDCARRFSTACLTNNFVGSGAADREHIAEVLDLFDLVLESSQLGIRKPDPRMYLIACERLGVDPSEVVYLDDLGVNLKPARQLGMTTIKVVDPQRAIDDLYAAVGAPPA